MKPLLTIFTPTYNRAHTLSRLYDSLCKEKAQNFIWLVVDDGSTDNTMTLINKWKDENRIPIKYHYQTNQGKPSAHNYGVRNATTDLFVCVDSDDWLKQNATERIEEAWNDKKNDSNIIGLLAKKGGTKGKRNIQLQNGKEESVVQH